MRGAIEVPLIFFARPSSSALSDRCCGRGRVRARPVGGGQAPDAMDRHRGCSISARRGGWSCLRPGALSVQRRVRGGLLAARRCRPRSRGPVALRTIRDSPGGPERARRRPELCVRRPPPAPGGAPDPHLIWINVRFALPSGHFNIGFADVVLIAAAAENLRRRNATLALSLLPGVICISLGEALLSTLPPNPPLIVDAIAASLVLFLTAGYVLTELAVSQAAAKTS